MQQTQHIHIRSTVPLVSPRELCVAYPMTEVSNRTVINGRNETIEILAGKNSRLLVVLGPCSIHDEQAALEYANKLKDLSEQVRDTMHLIMRVYFEKPRTVIGWKGLINDPHLDGSFDIGAGLGLARRILQQINQIGVPCGTELLDPITPQYVADLISWAAIGARTTESQTHRQMASGLSMPVGYKNGTDGNLEIAIHAMQAARHPHSFLGIDSDGRTCIVNTKGNPWGHLILRGGRSGPNYEASTVSAAAEAMIAVGLPANVMIDCSHANSDKDHTKQSRVWRAAVEQRAQGTKALTGLMLESNLIEGAQKFGKPQDLKYGISITDACIGWSETEELILTAHEKLQQSISTLAAGRTQT